jgi:tetratricopeptide (TPR) repeat protein
MAALMGGAALAHNGRHDQLANLDSQIAAEPKGAALYVRRAELHRVYREFAEADDDYAQALALEPENNEALWLRARAWLESGKARQAIAQLDWFLARYPDHAMARLIRAQALTAAGTPTQAASDYIIAITALPEPSPDLYLEARDAQQAAGMTWQAQLANVEAGIARLGPVPALEDAALDLELRGQRWDAALRRLERQAESAQRQERWLYRRGLVLTQAGRQEEAKAAFHASHAAIEKLPPGLRGLRATALLAEEVSRELRKFGVSVSAATSR